MNKLIINYYRDEMTDSCVFEIYEPLVADFIAALSHYVDVEMKEHVPWGAIENYCRARDVINSVFEVQGLKHREGDSCLPAIESLVAAYAKLK